jgi:hypothetical protein
MSGPSRRRAAAGDRVGRWRPAVLRNQVAAARAAHCSRRTAGLDSGHPVCGLGMALRPAIGWNEGHGTAKGGIATRWNRENTECEKPR